MRRYLANYSSFLIFCLFVLYFTKYQDVLREEIPYHDFQIQESEGNKNMDFNINSQFQQKILNYAKDGLLFMTLTDYFYLDLALNLHHSLHRLNISNYLIACMHHKACEELKRRRIQ